MGARAVITTGATLSGPSWPADSWIESWVMDTRTPLTNRIGVYIFCLPSMNLTSVFARPKGQEEYRLEGQCFKEASLIGSNGALFSWCKTSERFQEGTPLLPLGLSLWKLSRRRARILSLLMLKGEFPSLSAMAEL